MKKLKFLISSFIPVLFIIFGIIFGTLLITNYIISNIVKEQTKYENYINGKVVLNKDTLIIVDYSYLRDDYILSNGLYVSSKFVNKSIIVK